jgi:hypothetical protein
MNLELFTSPLQNKKVLVGLSVYNQRHHIDSFCSFIHQELPFATILIIDDNSPDGTGKFLDHLSQSLPYLKVLHRPKPLPISLAHVALMEFACDKQFDFLITLDPHYRKSPNNLTLIYQKLVHDHKDFILVSSRLSFFDFFLRPTSIFYFFINFWMCRFFQVPFLGGTSLIRGHTTELLTKLKPRHLKTEGMGFFLDTLIHIAELTPHFQEIEIPHQVPNDQKSSKRISEACEFLAFMWPYFMKKFFILISNFRK